jgi:plasmid stabilization system protein ParE
LIVDSTGLIVTGRRGSRGTTWWFGFGRRSGETPEFLAAVRSQLDVVAEHPEQCPEVHRRTRRALLRRFPYSLLYRVEPGAILLVAVFHAKRDPKIWRART